MLVELSVTDFAIVRAARVEFHPGFNALTGETGAGKSILVEAIELALGGRPGEEMIRGGADRAAVEARFDLSDTPGAAALLADLGIDHDGELILRRVVERSGRNKAFVNGSMATVAQLKQFGALLVDLHGQHETQGLFDRTTHVKILDRHLGLDDQAARYRAAYDAWGEAIDRLHRLWEERRHLEQELDLLRHQAGEIEEAALVPGEEERLLADRTVMGNAGKLAELSAEGVEGLDEGEPSAASLAAKALAALERIIALDPSLEPLREGLAGALVTLEESAGELRSYAAGLEHDPDRLEEVNQRIDLIRSLKRKYGQSVDEVIAFGAAARTRLESIEFDLGHLEALEAEVARLGAEAAREGTALLAARRKGSEKFSAAVARELADLAMDKSRLAAAFDLEADPGSPCVIDDQPVRLGPDGPGRMELVFSANPGEPPKPLDRIASGGEISRFMLALKSVLAGRQPAPVMVFDEIDAGIGGVTGDRVGEKLAALAKNSQVFCVTHLAQVASQADAHYVVSKKAAKGETAVTVTHLSHDGRIDELARMAGGGKATDAARQWADKVLAGR